MSFRQLLAGLTLLCVGLISTGVQADPNCTGKFANPITDYCWSCTFPIGLAGGNTVTMGQDENTSSINTSGNPFCACTNPPKVGMRMSFWEPARMVDVTRTPYCFVGMGGVSMDFGIDTPRHAQTGKSEAKAPSAFYHAHWYTNPLMFWLEVLLDDTCLEQGVFDVAYITEIDPLWSDSMTTFIINPDVALWGNPIAQAACALDCVAATAFGFGRDELLWCAGCQGSMFPLNGWVGSKVGGVQASSLITARMTSKLHREMLMWAASGQDGTCGYYPQPVMMKTNYKYTMLYPIPQTKKIAGKCCQPFGRTTALWGSGREFPVSGEDFVYQIFRKRDCCAGNLLDYFGGG